MAAPEFLVQATAGWARLYGDSRAVSVGVTYLHFAGLLLAGGAAVAADRTTLRTYRADAATRARHLAALGATHGMVIAGLALMAVSGTLMFLADVETFWDSRVFWFKAVLIVALLANGLLLRQSEQLAASRPERGWARLRTTSIVSGVLWFVLVLVSTVLSVSA